MDVSDAPYRCECIKLVRSEDFHIGGACAMLLDARGDQHRSERGGSRAIGRGRGGSQEPAKACVAGGDHSGDDGGLRNGRDHAPGRGLKAVCVALAGTVYARGGGRAAAR